jgi:hypothetical protein
MVRAVQPIVVQRVGQTIRAPKFLDISSAERRRVSDATKFEVGRLSRNAKSDRNSMPLANQSNRGSGKCSVFFSVFAVFRVAVCSR